MGLTRSPLKDIGLTKISSLSEDILASGWALTSPPMSFVFSSPPLKALGHLTPLSPRQVTTRLPPSGLHTLKAETTRVNLKLKKPTWVLPFFTKILPFINKIWVRLTGALRAFVNRPF